MDEDIHDDETVMRYIDGAMEPDERGRFEVLLANDIELRQKVEGLQLAVEAVKQAGTVQKVRGIHQEMMQEFQQRRNPSPVRRMVRRTLTVAASIFVLVVAVGAWWFYQLSPEEVYNEGYVHYTVSSSRGRDRSVPVVDSLYQTGNYKEVINTVPLNAHDSLLVALSYLQSGRLNQSIKWFVSLQNGSSAFREDADYYLSMAYLKNKEYDKSLRLMQEIKRNPNHLYRQQVSDNLVWKLRLLQYK